MTPPAAVGRPKRGIPDLLLRNWLAKLVLLGLIAILYSGFLRRLVDPLMATAGGQIDAVILGVVEIALLALYTLGLFAFPLQFWRRAFKFICLMTGYMALGPVAAAAIGAFVASLGLADGAWLAATAQIVGHLLGFVAGYFAYKLAWPRLERHKPTFNPAA